MDDIEPSSDAARARMEAQPTQDTSPELRLRSELHSRGLRYRVHDRPIDDLRREADVVFQGPKVAVFVDGCFWHGCPEHGSSPKSNEDFWREKIKRNRERDRDTVERLEEEGWTAVRIWEHENPVEAADRVEDVVRSRREDA